MHFNTNNYHKSVQNHFFLMNRGYKHVSVHLLKGKHSCNMLTVKKVLLSLRTVGLPVGLSKVNLDNNFKTKYVNVVSNDICFRYC